MDIRSDAMERLQCNKGSCRAVRLRRIIVVLELRKVRSIYAVAGRS
jgi:hypothetical protein